MAPNRYFKADDPKTHFKFNYTDERELFDVSVSKSLCKGSVNLKNVTALNATSLSGDFVHDDENKTLLVRVDGTRLGSVSLKAVICRDTCDMPEIPDSKGGSE